jgi:NAD(P)-dependent dehydrogenase (short-subunit alcohol dehydrogenase family)
MGKLEGKIAIVTGASQGGGYGCAIAMAQHGAAVVLVARTRAKLEAVAKEIEDFGGRALVHPADISDPSTYDGIVKATLDAFGRIDVLVNAAQSLEMRSARLDQITDEAIDALWRSGAVATLKLMLAVRPHMAAAGGGSIVNFASAAIVNPGNYGVYGGVKAAIQTIGRAAALEWAKQKIRVNTVLPMVSSPSAEADFGASPGKTEMVLRSIPMRRMGEPVADIGEPVAFLASDESQFITGSTFPLDGGQTYLR